MIPRTIMLRDFLSYREADIDLSRGGVIALAGDNGAGKSALAVDALTWALWGESRARSDDDLVRVGADECQATVVVEMGDRRYRIGRRRQLPKGARGGTSALSLELLNGEVALDNLTRPTIRETQEAIDRILGLDGQTFINSACLIQGRADEFARAAPKDRKDVLVDILALGRWQDWAGVAHEGYRKAEATMNRLDAALEAADGMLAAWDTLHTDLTAARDEVGSTAAAVASGKAVVDEARQLAAAQRERTTERSGLRIETARLDDLVRSEREQVQQLTTQIAAVPDQATVDMLAEKVAAVKQRAETLPRLTEQLAERVRVEDEIHRWEQDIAGRTRNIADLEQLATRPPDDAPPTQCPLCGQDLPDEAADRVEQVLAERRQLAQAQQERIAQMREENAVAERRLHELRRELTTTPEPPMADFELARTAADRLPAATAEHAAALGHVEGGRGLTETLTARQKATDQAVVMLGNTRERLTLLTVELEGEGDREAALAAIEAELRTLTIEATEASGRRDGLQGRIDQLGMVKEEAASKRKEQETQRADMELMGELERALGANGVQALLIDAAIPQIVEEANALLGLLSAGTTIDLRTQRAGKTTGRGIETLDLIVADGNGVRPYELYSGGERFRIDFATRIGLSRLLARRAASPCKTLIVDEGFGSQDGRGRMALLEALAMVQDQFELVLVITHLDDLREYFPSTVWIEKTINGSTVSLV